MTVPTVMAGWAGHGPDRIQAHAALTAAFGARICGARTSTLQQTPAPIALLDVINPQAFAAQPVIYYPTSTGGAGDYPTTTQRG